ncbi:response regulator [Patescibacteria group bacterium]|nr:response regulator [Patescibacteria group bacterium]
MIESAKKLLIVEDEKMLSEMYQDTFSQAGYEVFAAFTVDEGIKIARNKKPDLILLDILLPKESGIAFLQKLKKDLHISTIPVVAFSNYDDPKTRKEAINLGIKAYLLKTDFTPKDIVEKVKEYF